MKSLERSRRSADLDQVDPEHLGHETAEFSWDDLSREPFSGSQNNGQANHVEKLKLLLDDLSPDENRRAAAAEEARQRVLDSMQKVGSFGQNHRNAKNLSSAEKPKNEIDRNQSLSDISSTF
ncbi:hypothetical protein IKF92_03920 [Candidatus Saccharibacteria bacterium]|nr:hypothetical protein [Candidatus Saccharibacteria bacterium]